MEPRRIVLAVILMAAVLILTPIIFPSPTPVPGRTAVTDTLGRADTANSVVVDVGTPPPGSAGAAPAMASTPDSAAAASVVAIDTAVIATNAAIFRTTNRGASLIGAELQKYRQLKDKGRTRGEPVELAKAGDRLLSYRLVVPGDTVRLDRQPFVATKSQSGDTTRVSYDATVGARRVAISYAFPPDSYRVKVSAALEGVPPNSYLLVDLPPGFRSAESDTAEDIGHLAYAYKIERSNADAVKFSSLDPGERQLERGPLTWVVAKNKYFVFGMLSPVGTPGFAEADFIGGVRTAKAATRAQATVVVPLKAGNAEFELYVGPQEFKRLVAMGREFETSNPYGGWLQGMIQPFATMVIRVLLWMKATLGLSYGWILVIFGVTIRIILWPLNQRAMRSSMQMQRLSPELQAIQAKHKGDPQKLQSEMMALYKEHGMSPFSSLSGCLPMLIPLPVFFALFFVFQNTIEFRGVSFLWFPDISIKDPFYVIPILVAITAMALSYIGMKGMKANDQQKMMMYLMPAMMLVIFLNMASGLNLYYFVQNLASLPQQWLIARERGRATPLVRG